MMACDAVLTGQRFVAQAIAHIDCQAQSLGTYGFGALADPNSPVAAIFAGLLTLFVALFGLRLMMGEPVSGRDLVGDGLRLAIALTLATSWPAWRTLAYDAAIKGPGELATAIGTASALPGGRNDLVARLQAADDGIVLLTAYGTGRGVGGTPRSDNVGDSFRGIALADQEGLANGRVAFLAGAIGPLAIVRLGAGLLLALAPLMAGLLLLAGTRDLFVGWIRALLATVAGALALAVVQGVQLAILEPWLSNALALRDVQVLTPSVPTELEVIAFAFALTAFGLLGLVARIFFFGGFGASRLLPAWRSAAQPGVAGEGRSSVIAPGEREGPARAYQVAEAVAQTLRREERNYERTRLIDSPALARAGSGGALQPKASPPLGNSFRASEARNFRRVSGAGEKRDSKA
jgi:type IV secretion system protein VirB6